MSEYTADVRGEPAEARRRSRDALDEAPGAALDSRAAGGLFARLRKGPAIGGGAQRSMARQALRLQASRGNQYVSRMLQDAEQPANAAGLDEDPYAPASRARAGIQSVEAGPEAAAIRRDAAPAAIQREGSSTTVNMTLAEPTHSTYTLDAADFESAVNQMNARGEWGMGGAKDIAYTSGTVNEDGIVSSVTITATLFTTLPNWTQLSSKPQAVQDEWNRMLGALRGHENHHVSIGRTHLEGLRTALAAIHEDDLATTWSEKMTALQDAQNEYDASTTSGQTEGVVLDYGVEQPPEEEEEEGEESTEESFGIGEGEW